MRKGFTLIELLTVVLIVAILTGVALPQYRRVVDKARVAEAEAMLRVIYDSSERLAGEFGYASYEKLREGKGAANEANYSFARLDMFDTSKLPAGCTIQNHTTLQCKVFSYKISLNDNSLGNFAVAKIRSGRHAGTYIALNRDTLDLVCQPAAGASGDFCGFLGLDTVSSSSISF